MRIIRFLGEDGRIHYGQDHGDGSATVLVDPHGVLGPASDDARRQLLCGKHALVADDDDNMRQLIAAVLAKLGCECTLCADGREALQALDAGPTDLVVSDILMPHHNGYEIFAAAREQDPALPVLLVTGFGYDPHHSLVRASRQGLSAVLYKPFTPQELRDVVVKAVRAASKPAKTLVRCDVRLRIRRILSPLEPTAIIRAHRSFRTTDTSAAAPPEREALVTVKPNTAVTCMNETVRISKSRLADRSVRCGGELAVVIGAVASRITEADALEYALGYTAADDLEIRRPDAPEEPDPSVAPAAELIPCSLGPAIVTTDEIPDPNNLNVTASVNGAAVRHGSTAQMVRSIQSLIVQLSRQMTLEPGSVILTEPPPCLALKTNGADILSDGDEITVEIDGIGRLVNRVEGT